MITEVVLCDFFRELGDEVERGQQLLVQPLDIRLIEECASHLENCCHTVSVVFSRFPILSNNVELSVAKIYEIVWILLQQLESF
ncbi:unnamed protein product [Ceutorhynchus assimilis]|uniref:Uncharacterized protein n=1 Tax=Ceutorhynchus assimilis TaxID=467358 RepID=A0A9N9MW34_9CUCU|nr:unnamed protein product [Ceutorhynchus assimilis]